jgi:hypothetical protein
VKPLFSKPAETQLLFRHKADAAEEVGQGAAGLFGKPPAQGEGKEMA